MTVYSETNREQTRTTTFKLEVDVENPADQQRVVELLTPTMGAEAAEQFAFSIQTLMNSRPDKFNNRCEEATHALGQELTKQIGQEPSFFDISPNASLADFRARGPLPKVNYGGDYHSVAVLNIPKNRQTGSLESSVVVDLTYYNANRQSTKSTLIIKVQGDVAQALNQHYGGNWRPDFKFDVPKKVFRYLEN